MQKVVLTKSTFSHGVLQAQFTLFDTYAKSGIKVAKVVFYEYDPDTGEYEEISETDNIDVIAQSSSYSSGVQHAAEYVVELTDTENHLVKAIVYVDPSSAANVSMPCCAVMDEYERYWLFEVMFVDLTAYEETLVDSIKLNCDRCNVPIGTVNNMLKLFAIQAAVESQHPMLEYIYGKITCGATPNAMPSHLTPDCHCNG